MNEVKITVRVQNSAKAGFDAVGKEIDGYAKKFADNFSDRFSENLTRNISTRIGNNIQQVGRQAEASARAAGDHIGDTIGRRAGDRITSRITERLRDARGRFLPRDGDTNGARSGGLGDRERVHVDVDVNRQSFLQKVTGLARDAGDRISTVVSGALTSLFSGDLISVLAKIIIGGMVAAFASSAIGAAISSMLLLALGGGAIGAGIAIALKDPRIQAAVDGIQDRLKKMADAFGSHFKPILEEFFAPSDEGGGGLVGLIDSLIPMVDQLGKALAPVAGKLGDGLIGFLQNAIPPILRAMEKSAPVIEKLADKLPGLGDSVGKFFETISDGAPEASVFLGDLLELFGFLLEKIALIVKNLTVLYAAFRTCIVGMINLMGDFLRGAVIAFGWIPGIGPKLQGLERKFADFRKRANNELNGIRDRNVDIRIRVLGLSAARAALSVAQSLSAMGYAQGGIKGAADGGLKSGLSWVGEHGPELVKLPPGAQVHSAGDSRRMAGSGGELTVRGRIEVARATDRGLMDEITRMLRIDIFQLSGGDVQQHLGTI